MNEKPLVVIGAGGTGGHMFPAAAFAEEMRARGWAVGLISDDRGLRYAEHFPADWKHEVKASSPNLRQPLMLPGVAFKIMNGVNQAARKFNEQRPALVAGFGGYPAYPALSAARRKRIPIIIHEQNAVLGRVNRAFAKKAEIVASGFERLDRLPRGAAHMPIGNPVRAPIAAKRDTPYPATDGPLTLFITGGSQGAKILGEAIPLAIANHIPAPLRSRLKVVQQVREEQLDQVRAIYDKVGVEAELQPFFSDMPDRLAAAHMVIARSGAGTVSEIAAIGRPSILIPLKIAMDDHQTANAEGLADAGAADVLLEDNLYPNLLGELLNVRLSDGEDLRTRAAAAKAQGNINAASDLADLAERIHNFGSLSAHQKEMERLFGKDWETITTVLQEKLDIKKRESAHAIEENHDLPPPWTSFPSYHPMTIGWRMGSGEDTMIQFLKWWRLASEHWSEQDKIEFFKKWPARPAWLYWIIYQVWGVDVRAGKGKSDASKYGDILEANGFPSLSDAEIDIDPENWKD